MGRDDSGEVLVMRPSRADFSRPFAEYVTKVFKKHPDLPMFKVKPPAGWRPRRRPFPKLDTVEIVTPIKQICYGKGGSYRCILMEQKRMNVQRFKDISESEGHTPPESKRGKDLEDTLLERSFWSSVTINPPLYGADTPVSFFDDKLEYGWNLRGLDGCLLRQMGVPDIPGVTTPMCYFGMWKAFFSWHKEDADLFSINYLHFGAPKVWYCVAPSQAAKFERMAQSVYPELHRGCHAFMRHKDIMMSPQMLKTYGVEYTMAKQEPNEFMVLNAAAYHAGYNLGFNCAEAVNFAMQEWVDVGCAVERCKCGALKEGVRISMRLFGREGSSDEDDDSEDDDDVSGSSSEDEGSSEERGEEGERPGSPQPPRRRSGREPKPRDLDSLPIAAFRVPAAVSKLAAPAAGSKRPHGGDGGGAAREAKRAKGRDTQTARAAAAAEAVAAEAVARRRAARAGAEAREKAAVNTVKARKADRAVGSGPRSTDEVVASLRRAAAAAAALRAEHEARRAEHPARRGGSGGGAREEAESEDEEVEEEEEEEEEEGSDAGDGDASPEPEGPAPQVIVGGDSGGKFFYLVQRLSDAPSRPGHVVLRWLKESGPDGLFRPTDEAWEEKARALVDVRTQWVGGEGGRRGGWRLLTLRSRILDTRLVG